MSGPLSGVKVIELAGIGPGPYACMLMADLGADVLRLERDDAEPALTSRLLSRSRPTVRVDLKSEGGRSLVLELAERADALIEGFRPGVTERLGLGPNDLFARNPRLVYGRMTGYGQEGPLSRRAGHDINYIAISGALWPIGRVGQRPTPPLNLVGDFGGGSLFLVIGVVSAVLFARTTGEGQVVDAAMVDGSASMMSMTYELMSMGEWSEERGVNLLDSGAHFYDVYETKDHRYMAVGALEPKFYRELLLGLELIAEELPAQMDRSQWPVMREKFASIFATRDRDEWTVIFGDVDACVTPVLSPSEAAVHPYNTARNMFSVSGAIQPQPAPRFSKTQRPTSSLPPPASSASEEITKWGINADRQDALRKAGAFGHHD